MYVSLLYEVITVTANYILIFVSGDMSQPSPAYGAATQLSRRDSQEQIQMMTQRMKQMTMQSGQPMYQSDGYGGPRSPYDHLQSSYVPSSGSERAAYFQYYPQSAGNSYSNVVSRGKDVTAGMKDFILKEKSYASMQHSYTHTKSSLLLSSLYEILRPNFGLSVH